MVAPARQFSSRGNALYVRYMLAGLKQIAATAPGLDRHYRAAAAAAAVEADKKAKEKAQTLLAAFDGTDTETLKEVEKAAREAEKLATRGATPTPKSPVSQTLRTLANRLSKQLNLSLSISGTEAKGRITLCYTSAAQRQQIEALLSNYGPDHTVH